MNAYERPIHELSYDVLLVSILQVFFEIWSDDYRRVGTVPDIYGKSPLLSTCPAHLLDNISGTQTNSDMILDSYESPTHGLSYAVPFVSIFEVFYEI